MATMLDSGVSIIQSPGGDQGRGLIIQSLKRIIEQHHFEVKGGRSFRFDSWNRL